MKNIVLIRPPTVTKKSMISSVNGTPPLALAYLKGTIEKAGHKVDIIDAFGESINAIRKLKDTDLIINGLGTQEIIERIPDSIDVIGISSMFSHEWIYVKKLISELRNKFPQKLIILGGEHVNADYDYIVKCSDDIDIFVFGEGEETISEILNKFGSDYSDISGIAYKTKNGYKKNPIRNRIKKIDEIAWPSWEGIPLENYFKAGLGYTQYNARTIPMLATRGCPYQCTFCSSVSMWTTLWNYRDPEDVIKEIKYYIERYQINSVDFYDLTFIINRKWILEFCRILKREKLDINWTFPSGTRSEVLDREVLEALKSVGISKIGYAPESGSPTTIKRIKKRVNLDKMVASMKICIELGIHCEATLIFGFPEQTIKEVIENYLFLIRLAWIGVNDLTCFPFVPYPGSELHNDLTAKREIIKKEGDYELFLSNTLNNNIAYGKSWSRHIPSFTIPFLTLGGILFFNILKYLFRPTRVFKSIKNVIKGEPVGIIEPIIWGLYINIFKRKKYSKFVKELD